jgi:opacity protein-like surface antigen
LVSVAARILVVVGAALGHVAAATTTCVAADSDRLRYYLQIRGQDTNPWTGVHDHWGFSLGANLGRYWGLELSGDTFERSVEFGGKSVGEYAVGAFVPQLRLRYPFLEDRLVPYVVAGVGVAQAEFNDRKDPAFGVSIDNASAVFPVGTLGAGLEYYFADNLALGVELKYLLAADQTLTIGGTRHTQQVHSLFTTIGLRMLVPELNPQPLAETRAVLPTRFYIGLRAGGAFITNREAFPGIEIHPEPAAFFSTASQFFGAAIGLTFGRYLGIEMAADYYEGVLAVPGVGSVTEVGVSHFIPYLRLRYPLWDGRVSPHLFGGLGVSTVRTQDTKVPGEAFDVHVWGYGLAAGVGAGIEYFVASNLAVGVETRYLTARGHTARINDGPERDGHFDAVAVALSLRVFLAAF